MDGIVGKSRATQVLGADDLWRHSKQNPLIINGEWTAKEAIAQRECIAQEAIAVRGFSYIVTIISSFTFVIYLKSPPSVTRNVHRHLL